MHEALPQFLQAASATGPLGTSRLLGAHAKRITIENDRIYAGWDIAFADLSQIIRPAVYAQLLTTELWMYDDDRPRGFAVAATTSSPFILLSAGLLHLISYCSYHVTALETMAVRNASPASMLAAEAHFTEIVANHAAYALPLPAAIYASAPETFQMMVGQRDCMTALVLLHELGHIALGHLSGQLAHVADFHPRVDDADSYFHAREIAADDYAISAITNDDCLMVASTLFSAWVYCEAARRVTRGRDAHLSASHPLAINRLCHIRKRLAERSLGNGRPQSPGGLAAAIDWMANMVENPAGAGLSPLAMTTEAAHTHHAEKLAEHARLIAPYV